MREIKFRAWDKRNNILRRVFEIHFDFDEVYVCKDNPSDTFTIPFNDCELMQYTGLSDKNGKEIYEGDIVQGGRFALDYEVKFIKGCWIIGTDTLIGDMEDLVVIGNIYKNPNLLN